MQLVPGLWCNVGTVERHKNAKEQARLGMYPANRTGTTAGAGSQQGGRVSPRQRQWKVNGGHAPNALRCRKVRTCKAVRPRREMRVMVMLNQNVRSVRCPELAAMRCWWCGFNWNKAMAAREERSAIQAGQHNRNRR